MKVAVVVSGWHFGLDFYQQIEKQVLPSYWEMDLFCIAHRLPEQAKKDLSKLGNSFREKLDKVLYKETATKHDLKKWHFKLYPNTIGDWGCTNQWLDDYDYRDYDLFLFSHDDNLIMRNDFILQAIRDKGDWLVESNSTGMPSGWLRGSCEFFKKEMLDKMGGKFDLSETTLNREGLTDDPDGIMALNDWNTTSVPIMKFITDNNIKVKFLSPYYRVSKYCIEGERGWIHYSHGINTPIEEAGFQALAKNLI
jgi:hypothetical protein